jgi:nitrate reductase NapD
MSVSRRELLSGAAASPNAARPVCHISSLVVHCLPDAMHAVIRNIEAMPNMEVPESDPNGKFVVLLETEDESTILDGIGHIQGLKGVINATLAYHQIDDES